MYTHAYIIKYVCPGSASSVTSRMDCDQWYLSSAGGG